MFGFPLIWLLGVVESARSGQLTPHEWEHWLHKGIHWERMTCEFAPPLASYIAQVVRGSTMTTNSSKLLEHVLLRVSRGGEPWDTLGRDWTLDQKSLGPAG